MKYTFINNFSKEKLIKLYPEIKSQNIQIAGANVLVLDYGLYKYKFPTLSEEVRRNQISDILIKISLPQNTTSRQRMKRIARDIYCQSFQLKQKHPLLRWHMINEKKFSWMINALPINLTIEPTNVCNLNCIGCRDGIDTQGFMKFKDFKKVLLQFKRIEKLYLYSRGEPLLHPDIMKFIDFAKNSGTKYMEISTNFNIKNDKLIEDIAKSKLDKLLIGLDGATQETYQGFRRGGNFGLVISNIKKIKAWAPHCKLEIQVMPNKFNEHEIDRIKVLAKVLGADSLRVRTFFSKDTDFLPMNSLYRYETPYKDLSTIDNLTLTTKKFICKEIMDSLIIHWDGRVYPCCFLQQIHKRALRHAESLIPPKFPYNAFTASIDQIWMDEEYFNLRYSFLEDSHVKVCKLCNMIGISGKPLSHEIVLS